MKNKIIIASSFFLLGLSSPVCVMADDGPKPKEFFEKNYAEGGFTDQDPKTESPARTEHEENRPEQPKNEKGEEASTIGDSEPEIINLSSDHSGSSDGDSMKNVMGARVETDLGAVKTEKIKYIGAVLNSLDRPHFNTNIKELIEVANTHKLTVATVYLVGDLSQIFTNKDVMKLTFFGAKIKPNNQAPARYKLIRSPTWIIGLEHGEVLLESAGALSKFINKDGDFLDDTSPVDSEPESIDPVSTPSTTKN